MGSAIVRIGNAVGIICGPRIRGCIVCGKPSTKACDYPRKPKPSRALCNARMCDDHAVHVGPDLDWCHSCADTDAIAGAA